MSPQVISSDAPAAPMVDKCAVVHVRVVGLANAAGVAVGALEQQPNERILRENKLNNADAFRHGTKAAYVASSAGSAPYRAIQLPAVDALQQDLVHLAVPPFQALRWIVWRSRWHCGQV